MKNKIIFKTLMLKGEAGSTIVSMVKTGHVGTADIYTITFNDGSTTEISLENMSAITSVEKTSSTDTEDIYTITCADGSTQTFSVLNHNADIAAMSDDIDTIDARVDNFINSVVPNTVETLWTGSIKDVGDSATLSKAVSNFDYIDLYLLGSADSKYIRVPATQTAVQIQQQNLSDDASSNFLRLWEMGVSISGTTVSITKSIAWAWDDPDNSNPTVTANAQNGVPITRIDGVKIASNSPAELVDIRVGADGKTYNSAGAAVRGQIGDITEKTTNLFDINVLNAGSVSVTDNEAVGTAVAFTNAFFASIHTGIEYEGNTQYVISGKAKHDGSSASNNGLRIQVTYTDESTENIFFSNSWTSFNDFSLVTSASKTISKLSFNYSNVGSNVWHIKEMQITKGTTREKYIPYKTAVDYVARSEIEEIQNIIFEPDYYPLVWEYGSIDPSTGTDANSSENLRTGDIIHVKSGSKLIKNNNAVSLMAYFYEDYNESNFDSYTQIMPASLEEYTFTENAFVRFVLQNPTSLDHNPTWGNQVLESKIIDADSEYRKIGLEIGILGYSNYLGNAILIRFPNGEIMGIDSFIASAQTPLINDYVRFGALHFDYFMITHYHKDHVGNVQYLIEHGYIDENTIVFLPQDLDTSYTSNIFFDWNDADGPKAMYEAVKPALEASGATLIIPTEGQTVCVAGVTIKFWNCDHSVYYPNGAYHTSNYNDLSLCCYINLGNYNFCHTADLGPIGQQRMVDLNTMKKANLYTATHHGWDNGDASNYYGLLPAWINRLSPDVVFSEDYSAHNTHIMTKTAPMQSWCEASGVPNYRTAINGSMFIRLNECGWKLLGNYSRFIRNDKNWSYSDNSEHIET